MGLFLGFQPSALSFQLLGRGQISFSEQGVKGGYEMIVRQRWVIICKSSTGKNRLPAGTCGRAADERAC
jgi:hypothetical protein